MHAAKCNENAKCVLPQRNKRTTYVFTDYRKNYQNVLLMQLAFAYTTSLHVTSACTCCYRQRLGGS
jgi:hypothetical protein